MKKKFLVIALSLIICAQSTFAIGTNSSVLAAEGDTTGLTHSTLVGDLNGDMSIDALDFALLKSYLLGKIDSFPVQQVGQALFINEIMAANTDTIRDGDVDDPDKGSLGGAYSDWIELYNPGIQPINLTGYKLSDSSATWTFPSGEIQPKGYLIVWASDKNKVAKDGQLHTNFKLSASGEPITLKSPNDSVIDSVTFTALKDNESYGRKTDGSAEWVVFSKSTPSSTNVNSSEALAVKEPVFSHKAGFYTSEFNLQLSTDEADTKIYYTLNGSDPVPDSEGTYEYTNPILVKSRVGDPNVISSILNIIGDLVTYKGPKSEVFKCTTLKAIAIRNGENKSKIITNSYFVDNNMMSRYNLPVISLVTDQGNFFDNTTGIYVNGNFAYKGEEWERPVHIEFFEQDGTLGISQYSGIRINGGFSRSSAQKAFRLYAGHDYDDVDKYNYKIFPDLKKQSNGKKIDQFDKLLLRNSGNDYTWKGTMFRDALVQGLVSHLNVDTMAYRPSVLFLNGEFWGIYNIREYYDSDYIKSHYGADKNKVAMFDVFMTPKVQDAKPYQDDVINYLKNNNITNDSVYENIKTKIDIENYINYNVTEIYCGNTDWPSNNTSIWKYKTDDGKYHPEASYGLDGRWRWLLKDTDFAFGFKDQSPSFNSIAYATSEELVPGAASNSNSDWAVFLLKTLIQNTEFRNQFINSFADQLNTSFIPSRVINKIDEFKAGIETAMPEQCSRWGYIKMANLNPNASPTTSPTWYDNIQVLKNYAEQRPSYMRQYIVDKFINDGVTGTSEINLTTDTAQGYVKVNSIDIKNTTPGISDASNWTGIYFKGVPVTLKAIPNEGYKFDHWEGISGVTATSESITFIPDANVSVRAVFVKVED